MTDRLPHSLACQESSRGRYVPHHITGVNHDQTIEDTTNLGVDIICAQGGEAGGHTGDIPFTVLIPACVDLCKNAVSPLTGRPVMVIAAGGIADGRGLAAALSYGAAGVWVGTRFVASVEAGAPPKHKEMITTAGYDDLTKTLIYSGRPMSVRKTRYVIEWYVFPSLPRVSCTSILRHLIVQGGEPQR